MSMAAGTGEAAAPPLPVLGGAEGAAPSVALCLPLPSFSFFFSIFSFLLLCPFYDVMLFSLISAPPRLATFVGGGPDHESVI